MGKQHPAVRGLTWHRTQHYSFFLPMDWHRLEWSDGRDGEIHGPDPNDPYTVFAVAIKDLGMRVTIHDLDVLAEGFFESLQQLPACKIESRKRNVAGQQLELEAQYTYEDQGETRKCWMRVLYHMTWQIAMTAQGATPEKYDYWLPWFFEAMKTAKVHSVKPEQA